LILHWNQWRFCTGIVIDSALESPAIKKKDFAYILMQDRFIEKNMKTIGLMMVAGAFSRSVFSAFTEDGFLTGILPCAV
jgi:hypothetical protein